MSLFTPFAFYGSAPAVGLPDITGGTIYTYTSGSKTYKSHTFTGDGTLVVNSLGNLTTAQLLVVAGGGAGGFGNTSGGGGAGGYILSSSYALTTTTYNVKVGAGGAPNYTSNATSGSPGNLSAFYNVTASGGGGGMGDGMSAAALAGGSGGGAGVNYNNPGAGIFGQGFSGSRGNVSGPPYPAGGGGGANNQGGTGSYVNAGGSGSFNYLRSGSAISYAGGGFGGTQFGTTAELIFTSGSTGGSGRGGNKDYSGGEANQNSTAGLANYGGGGGGGGGAAGDSMRSGSAGGSGIVIVTYLYQ